MPPLPLSPATLVGRAKTGDQQAFLGLYEMHVRNIYSLSLRLTGEVTAAENLTRDTFTLAFRTLDVCDDAMFARWLYCCAAKAMASGKGVACSLSAGDGNCGQDS